MMTAAAPIGLAKQANWYSLKIHLNWIFDGKFTTCSIVTEKFTYPLEIKNIFGL